MILVVKKWGKQEADLLYVKITYVFYLCFTDLILF